MSKVLERKENSTFVRRNYSIVGDESIKARQKGLVQATWYISPIPKERLKQLMKRKDWPAIRDTILMFLLLIGLGYLAYLSWGTWWAIPAFLLYGNIYNNVFGSRWHECGHGTAFKTPWMNEALYQLSSFMILFQPTWFKMSHARHHTDTIIVGRDPEIAAPKPPQWFNYIHNIFNIRGFFFQLKTLARRAIGKLNAEEKDYIDEKAYSKVIWESRIHLAILFIVWGYSIYIGSILPALFIALPLVYGTQLGFMLGMCQHSGLHEDVLDHRLNTRTFRTNFFIRFIYWNMNYHIEHHMYPLVPYHALPALHEEIKADCPSACPSLISAFKETISAMWKQRKDPNYSLIKSLPPTANPYKLS
jgi:fatty acid desaturase